VYLRRVRDLALAFRSLRRTPGFSFTVLLALTLGIGAATTVFSVADRGLFRPLPYTDPDRLVTVGADIRIRGFTNWSVSGDEFDAWRSASHELADLAGYQSFGKSTLTRPDAPVEIAVHRITLNFLSVLGVMPAMGRPFVDADFLPSAPPSLLLTDATWRRVFSADTDIVGQFVTVNGAPTLVAGVLPRAFVFPTTALQSMPDVLVPLVRTQASSGSRLSMIGRLEARATVSSAAAEINSIAASRHAESGVRNAVIDGATVEPLGEALAQGSRAILLLFVGAVATLVLIGCANVANLVLARNADRHGELALRTALGASRGSLVRLLLTEGLILALAGSAAGACLAYVAIAVIGPLMPADLQKLGTIALDQRALIFATMAGVSVMLLAAIGPALSSARVNLLPALGQASGRVTGVRWRMRQILVAFEVTLAVVLLVGGGLMVNTMVRLLRVDLGYTPESTLTMRVQLPRGKEYPERSPVFVARVIEAARGVSGVSAAGVSSGALLTNTLYAGHYRVDGFPYEWMNQGLPKTGACCTQTQYVSSEFFAAAGIPIVRGRAFTAADAAAAPAVSIISERLARRFPAGMDPIGHYLTAAEDGASDNSDRRLIVGVARDVRDMRVEREPLHAIYLPIEERGAAAVTLILRTVVPPMSISGAVQKAVQTEAGPVIITDALTLGGVITRSVGARHLNAWLFGSFGVLGLFLAAIGIGSVVSYSVARRTREMGVRIALGARPGDVRRLVVWEAMVPVIAGLAAGVGASLALSRFVESLLFGVQPRDAWTYFTVCLLLAIAAFVAALLPARRAARVNPIVALRAE